MENKMGRKRAFLDWLLLDHVSGQLVIVLAGLAVAGIFAGLLIGARRRYVRHERIRAIVGNTATSVEAIAAGLGCSLDQTVELLNIDMPRGLTRVEQKLPNSNCPWAIVPTRVYGTIKVPAARVAAASTTYAGVR
jgi:DNA-binding transcriptional LysR family regulator